MHVKHLMQLLAHSRHSINGGYAMNKVPGGSWSPDGSGMHIQIIMTQHGNWLTTKCKGTKRKINVLLKWGQCYNKGGDGLLAKEGIRKKKVHSDTYKVGCRTDRQRGSGRTQRPLPGTKSFRAFSDMQRGTNIIWSRISMPNLVQAWLVQKGQQNYSQRLWNISKALAVRGICPGPF